MRPPSQPSPFSPELQTFILTKFDPLLNIVRELNDRLQAAEKDRFRLERRVSSLEEQVKRLQVGDTSASPEEAAREDLMPLEAGSLLAAEEALTRPWLFSCQTGTPTASLQALLEFSPVNTVELDVRQWNSEDDMWIAFLENLPSDIPYVRPASLSLHDLRASARGALCQACKRELLIVLRQVPGSQEAARNKHFITFVAIMAAALSEAWDRVERTDPTSLGRSAIVLVGEGIGTRLRAGRNRFTIEPIN